MQNIIHSAYFSREPLKTSTHHHDCHQIIYILKGETEICVNGTKHKTDNGSIIVFSRYENHSVTVLSEEYERFVLRINPRYNEVHTKIYSLLSNRPAGFKNIIKTDSNSAKFKELFNAIITEYKSPSNLSEEMLTSLTNQLLIMIYRALPYYSEYLDEHNFDTILKLQKELENNCSHNYSLVELAKKYNMSVSSLSHRFKKITGVSVMNYLLSCRIANAKYYLTKTDLSISEIVERCGFSDNSNFTRTFKNLNGITPTKFRNLNKH